jgi:hypothetical protein
MPEGQGLAGLCPGLEIGPRPLSGQSRSTWWTKYLDSTRQTRSASCLQDRASVSRPHRSHTPHAAAKRDCDDPVAPENPRQAMRVAVAPPPPGRSSMRPSIAPSCAGSIRRVSRRRGRARPSWLGGIYWRPFGAGGTGAARHAARTLLADYARRGAAPGTLQQYGSALRLFQRFVAIQCGLPPAESPSPTPERYPTPLPPWTPPRLLEYIQVQSRRWRPEVRRTRTHALAAHFTRVRALCIASCPLEHGAT